MGNPPGRGGRANPAVPLDQAVTSLSAQLRGILGRRPLGRIRGPFEETSLRELAAASNALLEALERAEARAQAASLERAELDRALTEMEDRLAEEILGHEKTINDLERQRAVVRLTVDGLPYCVFWRDRNGVYLGANHNQLRALGLASLDQLVGKSPHDLCSTREEADRSLSVDRRVMESGEPVHNLEEIQQRPDGPHSLLVSKVPLRDDRGAVIGILGMSVDVTDRRSLPPASLRRSTLKSPFDLPGTTNPETTPSPHPV